MFPRLAAGRVIQRHHQWLMGAQQFRDALENGIKQGMRLPAAAREQVVFRRPVPKLSPEHADRTADRAATEAHQQGQGVFLGPAKGPMIGKATLPTAQQLAQAKEQGQGLSLRVQCGKRVGTGAQEAVLASHVLGQRRDDRFAIQQDTMAFGDAGENLGDV